MATLKEQIASDIGAIFCKNADEFCDLLKIGLDSKHTFEVYGSMQSNAVDNNSGNNAPLQKVSRTLLVPYPIAGTLEVNVGDPLYINDIPYRVSDINPDEMGLATILLEKAADRRRFG